MKAASRAEEVNRLKDQLAATFAHERVDFVPDPMVLRVAELFLLGRSGLPTALPDSDPDDVWSIIDKNIDGLLAFFHVLMTRDRIPLIDYQYTFAGHKLFELLGSGDLAAEIHPPSGLYEALAQDAQSRVVEMDLGRLDGTMLSDIAHELGATGYDWYPAEHRFEHLKSPGERIAATFAVGGMIFGGYAQAARVDHLLQSKRARLFTELVVPQDQDPLWGFQREEELYDRLRQTVSDDARFRVADYRLPPSVLPLVLASTKPESPAALFGDVLDIRTSRVGSAYKRWHTGLRFAWAQGRHDVDAEEAVGDVTDEVRTRFAARDGTIAGLDVTLSAGVGVNLAAVGPVAIQAGVNVEREARVGVPDRLRNWFVDNVRFRGHRKLLLRMSLEQATFDNLTLGLKNVWYKG